MTDKEKLDAIRAEIHRLINVRGYDRGMANDLFTFMDSLPNDPVSEDLEEAAKNHAVERFRTTRNEELAEKCKWSFKAGAKWQITKLMKDATEVTVHIDAGGYPYTPEIELYDYDKDVPLAKEGDKYKVVLIKEN